MDKKYRINWIINNYFVIANCVTRPVPFRIVIFKSGYKESRKHGNLIRKLPRALVQLTGLFHATFNLFVRQSLGHLCKICFQIYIHSFHFSTFPILTTSILTFKNLIFNFIFG